MSSDLNLNDRDVLAIYKVLENALHSAEHCYEGARHARTVFLQLQQYVDNKVKTDKDFEEKLKINL